MKEIYKIEVVTIGWITDHSYYESLPNALKNLKSLISEEKNRFKKDSTLAKKEDIPNGKSNGILEKNDDEFDKSILYSATVYSWHKTSYEYDEWDVEGQTYRIKKIEVI